MEIKNIHYKRTKNLGNYESETFEAFAEVTEEDNIDAAIAELKQTVLNSLGIEPEPPDMTQAPFEELVEF